LDSEKFYRDTLKITPGMGVMAILKARNFTIRQWYCDFSELERQIEYQAFVQEQDYVEARHLDDERKRKKK